MAARMNSLRALKEAVNSSNRRRDLCIIRRRRLEITVSRRRRGTTTTTTTSTSYSTNISKLLSILNWITGFAPGPGRNALQRGRSCSQPSAVMGVHVHGPPRFLLSTAMAACETQKPTSPAQGPPRRQGLRLFGGPLVLGALLLLPAAALSKPNQRLWGCHLGFGVHHASHRLAST
jgi:hypothetical protein